MLFADDLFGGRAWTELRSVISAVPFLLAHGFAGAFGSVVEDDLMR